MNAAILDYGAGNLHSLAKALAKSGTAVTVTASVDAALSSDLLVLPGVGAFASACTFLEPVRETIRQALEDGLPCLGICLGMQLLFESSDEGEGRGLGFIAGHVRQLRARRIPHIGWNCIDESTDTLLGGDALETAYFANSFVCDPVDQSLISAWTTHESDRFPAAVASGHVMGVQFHPEKSSAPGLAFISAFLDRSTR